MWLLGFCFSIVDELKIKGLQLSVDFLFREISLVTVNRRLNGKIEPNKIQRR